MRDNGIIGCAPGGPLGGGGLERERERLPKIEEFSVHISYPKQDMLWCIRIGSVFASLLEG